MLVALCTGEVCDGVVVRRYTHTVCVQKYDVVHGAILALHVQQAQVYEGTLTLCVYKSMTWCTVLYLLCMFNRPRLS